MRTWLHCRTASPVASPASRTIGPRPLSRACATAAKPTGPAPTIATVLVIEASLLTAASVRRQYETCELLERYELLANELAPNQDLDGAGCDQEQTETDWRARAFTISTPRCEPAMSCQKLASANHKRGTACLPACREWCRPNWVVPADALGPKQSHPF
jgi:hypothetical protein